MIKIRSMTQGFRRAGVMFSKKFTTFQDGHFTPEQLAALKAEPMLEVQDDKLPIEIELGDPGMKEDEPDDDATARDVLGGMTNDRLKADCDAMGLKYPANVTKNQLVDLILENTAPAPEE